MSQKHAVPALRAFRLSESIDKKVAILTVNTGEEDAFYTHLPRFCRWLREQGFEWIQIEEQEGRIRSKAISIDLPIKIEEARAFKISN